MEHQANQFTDILHNNTAVSYTTTQQIVYSKHTHMDENEDKLN